MFDGIKNLISWIKLGKTINDVAQDVKEKTKMESKPIYKSKTFWFNALTGALTVAAALQNSALAADPKVQAGVVLFITVGNAVLRLISDQPVTITPKQ